MSLSDHIRVTLEHAGRREPAQSYPRDPIIIAGKVLGNGPWSRSLDAGVPYWETVMDPRIRDHHGMISKRRMGDDEPVVIKCRTGYGVSVLDSPKVRAAILALELCRSTSRALILDSADDDVNAGILDPSEVSSGLSDGESITVELQCEAPE